MPRMSTHVLRPRGTVSVPPTSEEGCSAKRGYLQPVPACPPEGEDEEGGHDEGRDLARVGVESARYQSSTNKARAKVTSG